MRRIFVPRDRVGTERARLSEDDVHYLRDVLRLGPGAHVEVFDGEGGTYTGRVAGDWALLVGPRRSAPPVGVHVDLAFALARGERSDLVVQKATELGVFRLSPFEAERSVVRLDRARSQERTRRWQRIAAEAARQSGRSDVPAVEPPATLSTVVSRTPPEARIVVLYEGGGEPLEDVVDRGGSTHLLVVGPEGGLARGEVQACVEAGARVATLGPRILRFETAAIVAVALVQHLVGGLARPEL